MAYIFLDESGDLGFDFNKAKTSRFFIVTCLFVKQKGPLEKIVKKIFHSFSKKEVRSHHGVLHAYKEKPATRKKLLSELSRKDVVVVSIYLDKTRVYTKLQDEKHVLYNYVANIVLDRVCTKQLIPIDETIEFIPAKRETNKFLTENFVSYVSGQMSGRHGLKLRILPKYPQEEKCLQVADHVSWALFRRREHGDGSYADIIADKVAEESPLFP